MAVTSEWYEIGETSEGLRLKTQADDAVYVEKYENFASVTWTTDMRADKVLEIGERLLNLSLEGERLEVLVFEPPREQEFEEIGWLALSSFLDDHGNPVVVRADIDTSDGELALIWQSGLGATEFGIVATNVPLHTLQNFFEESGVESIKQHSAELAGLVESSLSEN